MKEDLLDILALQFHERCLSDLKARRDTMALQSCIEQIPVMAYSLEEWTECANYIYESKETFATAEEARRFLMGEDIRKPDKKKQNKLFWMNK